MSPALQKRQTSAKTNDKDFRRAQDNFSHLLRRTAARRGRAACATRGLGAPKIREAPNGASGEVNFTLTAKRYECLDMHVLDAIVLFGTLGIVETI